MGRSKYAFNKPHNNPRITPTSEVVIEPVHDANAYRKSVREFAAKIITIQRAKQQQNTVIQTNSYGRVEGGPGGFGEPLRNRGYYGVEPPLVYSFTGRPTSERGFSKRNLGGFNQSIFFSNIPAQQTTISCPPKKTNIR